MQWTEATIVRAIALQHLARKCVVLVDNCNWTGHECDVLAVTMDLRIIDVEVKISRADLKADAGKDKWWHREAWRFGAPEPERVPRAWPPRVWKHYYAMPRDIWKPELLDCLPTQTSGILLLSEGRGYTGDGQHVVDVHCERRAAPNKAADRITAAQALDIARLANLRMWDAYARAEKLQRAAACERVPA